MDFVDEALEICHSRLTVGLRLLESLAKSEGRFVDSSVDLVVSSVEVLGFTDKVVSNSVDFILGVIDELGEIEITSFHLFFKVADASAQISINLGVGRDLLSDLVDTVIDLFVFSLLGFDLIAVLLNQNLELIKAMSIRILICKINDDAGL